MPSRSADADRVLQQHGGGFERGGDDGQLGSAYRFAAPMLQAREYLAGQPGHPELFAPVGQLLGAEPQFAPPLR
jgi:hypothetical protein